MKFFLLYITILITTIITINAKDTDSCILPKNEILTIGCTTKCTKVYTKALFVTAKELNYNIKIIKLKSNQNYRAILSEIDGIISPGGHDIDPKYYSKFLSHKDKNIKKRDFIKYAKSSNKGRKRDAFEFNLFQYYLKDNRYKELPVLGICYGMQMLAVAKDIPLYIDILNDIKVPARRKINDSFKLDNNSNISPYIDTEIVSGYKNHHQAIDLKYFNTLKKKGLLNDVTITGRSNNGKIAEVLEFKNRPVIGVQFHPEKSSFKTRKAIFNYFLINACKKKQMEHYLISF